MEHRSPLRRRSRNVVSVLLGLTSLLVSCERSPETLVSPLPDRPLVAGGAVRAVTAGQYAHVYIHAFQDDWPLFMGDRASASFTAASEVAFVYTSAGDGNLGLAYVQTRETAVQAAVDALQNVTGNWTCSTQTVLAHAIRRCAKGIAVAYYMRLPDGSPSGSGYATRGSMSLLRDGTITSLTALDGTATYTSWSDVTSTIRAIVDLESANQGAPYVEVHAPDYDRTLNPGDHPDHLATADAVNAASSQRSWNLSWYVDIATQNQPQNLSQAAHDLKQSAYYAYDAVMGAAGYGYGQYDASTQAWLWRTYYRSASPGSAPAAAPSALQALAASSTRVDLTWTNASTSATAVEVQRAPDNAGVAGTYAVVATVGGTATTYSNTGLAANTRYWYRVRATSANGASAYSNESSATTPIVPAAPTGLAAAAASSTEINLTWKDAATNEMGYTVERAPDNAGTAGAFASVATLAAGAITYRSSGLTGSTRYWFRVRAFNATDVSAYSANASATTQASPGTPTNFKATAASSSRINLTWSNVSGETGYNLERAPDNSGAPGTWTALATLGKDVASYADQTGLTPATRYWYRIRSFAATDTSAFTAPVSGTTMDVLPAAPTTLAAVAASATQINLSWTDNSSNETSFSIERAPDNKGVPGGFAQIATVGANVTTYANTGLTVSTRYWYRVRAVNSIGNSAYSNSGDATTLAQNARTDFFFHAHEDDWQLFMGNEANVSYSTAARVVFVYASAGDANLGTAYWQTRELGAQASMDNLMGTTGTWTCASQSVNAHAIHRCTRDKVVGYFMRLPDGATTGDGFGGRGSMTLLQSGSIASLRALDGSTTYTSWTDLVNTVRGIADLESGNQSAPYVEVNLPDYDRTLNQGDHADHLAVADLVHSAASTRSWNQTIFIDYRTQYLATNLTQAQHDVEQRLFYAYDNVVGGAGYGYSQFESSYQDWLWRSYSRRIVVQ